MRFLFFLLLISSTSLGQNKEYKAMLTKYYDGFPTISQAEAVKKVGKKNIYFLDTREKNEFNIGHIKGAKVVGFDHFQISTVKNIPKDAEIIVYCSIGARSQTIGKKLNEAGYSNVKNLYGGLFLWSNLSQPMVDMWENPTKNIHGYSREWGKWVTKGNVVY